MNDLESYISRISFVRIQSIRKETLSDIYIIFYNQWNKSGYSISLFFVSYDWSLIWTFLNLEILDMVEVNVKFDTFMEIKKSKLHIVKDILPTS